MKTVLKLGGKHLFERVTVLSGVRSVKTVNDMDSMIGKGIKELRSMGNGATQPMERCLDEHIADIVDIAQRHGDLLADSIRCGQFNPEKVGDVRNRLLEEIKVETRKLEERPSKRV